MKAKGFGIIGLGMIAEFHASAIEHMVNAYVVQKHKTSSLASPRRKLIHPYWLIYNLIYAFSHSVLEFALFVDKHQIFHS